VNDNLELFFAIAIGIGIEEIWRLDMKNRMATMPSCLGGRDYKVLENQRATASIPIAIPIPIPIPIPIAKKGNPNKPITGCSFLVPVVLGDMYP